MSVASARSRLTPGSDAIAFAETAALGAGVVPPTVGSKLSTGIKLKEFSVCVCSPCCCRSFLSGSEGNGRARHARLAGDTEADIG